MSFLSYFSYSLLTVFVSPFFKSINVRVCCCSRSEKYKAYMKKPILNDIFFSKLLVFSNSLSSILCI